MNPLLVVGVVGTALYGLYEMAKNLFGHGNTPPARPELPGAPNLGPGTSNPNEQHSINQGQQNSGLLGTQALQAPQHADEVAKEINDMKKKVDDLYAETKTAIDRVKNGGTPQTGLMAQQAERDGIEQLRNLIGGGAQQVARAAGQIPMPTGLMGMPGGFGGGFPGFGGIPAFGGGAVPNPLTNGGGIPGTGWHPPQNEHTPSPLDPPKPPTPPGGGNGAGPAPVNPVTPLGAGPVTTTPNGAAPKAAANGNLDVVSGSSRTTAPDDVAAKALRHAVEHPNDPHMASAGYADAGITLPSTGDPGKSVGIGEAKPGDIIRVTDEHGEREDMVWDHDHALAPDGKLIPIGEATAGGSLKGVYHVQRQTDQQQQPAPPEGGKP